MIRRNVIIGAGTGLYLASSDDAAPFVNGLIEHNVVIDTIGYNTQVKRQQPRPTNVGLPTGQSRTIIRHNVFSKQYKAANGASAQSNLLVGICPDQRRRLDRSLRDLRKFPLPEPDQSAVQGRGQPYAA